MIPAAPRAPALVRPGLIAALLLAWFWIQTVSVSPEVGITNDEPVHLTAGYSYWLRGDYRLQPENGQLPQRLAALPLLWLRPNFPGPDHPGWKHADARAVAHDFLFASGNHPGRIVFLGRLMIATLSLALGVLVYFWAKGLFGPAGGVIATALFAISPNFLAHGGLATSDIAVSLGFAAATLSGWRLLHRVSPGRVVLFGLALAGLALAKHSAVLFVPVFILLLGATLLRGAPLRVRLPGVALRLRGRGKVAALGGAVLVAFLLAWTALWAGHGFRYQATADGTATHFPVSWDTLLAPEPFLMGPGGLPGLPEGERVLVQRDAVRSVVAWARTHHLLPEAYLHGFIHSYTYAQWRPAYFLGEYRITGWAAFFPTIYLLKTPLAVLALLLAAGWRLAPAVCSSRLRHRLLPLVVLGSVYAVFALTSKLNIGYRHLLPLEAVLCVGGGALAGGLRPGRALVVLLLLLAAQAESWSARPDYLSFFNRLSGGPDAAYRLVVDSSLDWGQGLPALAAWQHTQPGDEPLYLAYFGAGSPGYFGVQAARIGDAQFDSAAHTEPRQLGPGLYAVSATLLQGVYTPVPGPWTLAHEKLYRELAAATRSAADGPPVSAGTEAAWNQIRFARLRHYLLSQTPLARPDPSILVYRLDARQLAEALP
jgi:hypothetical protein